MHKGLSLVFSLSCCTLGNFLLANSAIAQEITSDGTTDTQVTPEGNGNFTINRGDRAGNNLFHSFDNFSVPTNGSASFNNATDISNIFSRVTGGNISNIDGLIEANGTANLFLVNPAGIMFGNNARLDIGGSFLGTTADSILFEDGTFSATDLDNPPLLTINAPIGLNFRDNPSGISNNAGFQEFDNGEVLEDSGLTVDEGEFITLVGGDITLNNGRLTAPGGRIELGGLSEAGIVQLNPDLSLNFAEGTIRSDVSLTGIAELDVTSGGGGDINIYARDINIRGGSDICAGIGADDACGSRNDDFGSIDAQAGDITFDALETITIGDRFSVINNRINNDAFGNAGNIEIKARSLVMNDVGEINATILGQGNAGNINIDAETIDIKTSNISSNVFGQGNAGNVVINATESLDISGDILTEDGEIIEPGGILNQVERDGIGQGGNITIETPILNVSNGAKVQVATFGDGNPGNLSILARDINVFNTEDSSNRFSTGIFAEVSIDPRNEQFASGSATDLTIETEILSIRGGATVSAGTSGIGDGSNISINATELVEIIGTNNKNGNPSNINANVDLPNLDTSVDLTEISRNGGNITIDTNQLNIKDGGRITANTLGTGNAGNITVDLRNLIVENSAISNSTFGVGNSGNLTINASDSIVLRGERPTLRNGVGSPGGLFAQVEDTGVGQAGNILINTDLLSVSDGSKVQVATFGNGDAGSLTVKANTIDIFNTPVFSDFTTGIFADVATDPLSENPSQGIGGNIQIETNILRLIDGGKVTASTGGVGDAGNITIEAKESIEISGIDPDGDGASLLGAEVETGAVGSGGDIAIETGSLTISNEGRVSTISLGSGTAGEIDIQANSISLSSGGGIDAATQSNLGEGANISLIVADEITLQDNGFISAQAFNDANGGNLTIDTDFIIAFPDGNNDIIANAQQGQGGVITINAESILGITERPLNDLTNDINASSEDSTLDGDIVINTSDINPIQGATELPINPVDLDRSVVQACRSNQQTETNSLAINGRGGVPAAPTAPLSSESVTFNGQPVANFQQNAIATSKGYIIPARGAVKTKDGRIILTANPSSSYERSPNGLRNCNGV